MSRIVKSELKVFSCEICDGNFSVPYIGVNNAVIVKTCKNCYIEVKRRSASHSSLSPDDIIKISRDGIVSLYNKNGVVPTFVELTRHLKMSSKTICKAFRSRGVTFSSICDELGIKHRGRSKFQNAILTVLHEVYKGHSIVSEKQFDGLISPKTGARLFLDIYIEDFNIAVECDGGQHGQRQPLL